MINVTRHAWIDKSIDRLASAYAFADVGRRDRNGRIVSEDDGAVRRASVWERHSCLPRAGQECLAHTRQHRKIRQLENAIDIFPFIQFREIVVADDPVERCFGILSAQLFEGLDGV